MTQNQDSNDSQERNEENFSQNENSQSENSDGLQAAGNSVFQGNTDFSNNTASTIDTPQKPKPDVPLWAQIGIGCGATIGSLIFFSILSTFFSSLSNNINFDTYLIITTSIYLIGIVTMNFLVYKNKKWGGFVVGSLSVLGLMILLFGLCVSAFSNS